MGGANHSEPVSLEDMDQVAEELTADAGNDSTNINSVPKDGDRVIEELIAPESITEKCNEECDALPNRPE